MKKKLSLVLIFLLAAVVLADTSGPASPGTIVEDQSSGSTAWSNYENAGASDDNYATVTLAPLAESYLIKATNFGHLLPAGTMPVGVTVEIEKRGNVNIRDKIIKLVKSGAITGDNKADGLTWPSISDAYRTHGGASDLWGVTLTRDDVNASNFGVVVSAENTDGSNSNEAKVDHIRTTITYVAVAMPRRMIKWDGELDLAATLKLGQPVYRQTREAGVISRR